MHHRSARAGQVTQRVEAPPAYRAGDVLAYFDRPGTSNGPNRLEHLRGTALGFRNVTNYITRALLDTGGFRPLLHPLLR